MYIANRSVTVPSGFLPLTRKAFFDKTDHAAILQYLVHFLKDRWQCVGAVGHRRLHRQQLGGRDTLDKGEWVQGCQVRITQGCQTFGPRMPNHYISQDFWIPAAKIWHPYAVTFRIFGCQTTLKDARFAHFWHLNMPNGSPALKSCTVRCKKDLKRTMHIFE